MTLSPLHLVRVLARRMLAERRRLIGGISLAGFVLALLTTVLYSSLGAEYDALFDDMPAALVSMLGDADLSTLEGWLQAEVFSFMGPGMVIGTAIAVGSGALAGAEEQGRLALITAGPLRRSTLITAVTSATAVSAIAITVALFLGIMAGAMLAGLPVAVGNVIAACLLLLLLAVTLGLCAIVIGALTGSRGAALTSAVGVSIASYASFSFFPLSETLEPFAVVSFWHPFASSTPLLNGLRPGHATVFLVASSALYLMAVASFERRDLTG